MSQVALFVHHKASPGRRDAVQATWEKWIKPRAESNPDHLQYYFCFDDEDPDSVCVFQLFADEEAPQRFMSGDWYPQYLNEISEVVSVAPTIQHATLQWQKQTPATDAE